MGQIAVRTGRRSIERTNSCTDRQMVKGTDKQLYRQTDSQTDGQTAVQTDRQTVKGAEKQFDRRKGRWMTGSGADRRSNKGTLRHSHQFTVNLC